MLYNKKACGDYMKFDEELVNNLADKLLIGLSKEENELVLNEFDAIDKNCDLVTTIEGIENIEPMTRCLDDFDGTLREDVDTPSVELKDLLKNAGKTDDREIVIPKVVG